ncbi:peptidylprolyl isomerase [Taibaiella koreensis]|uniref:peptidylprolyl isomerase n=1 Tax=Taibaiella koreensis TaxID=1268548 RepID=UPI000E59A4EC|nr:peptidylprolyl isomerase [Taibaiella koreensis]
MKKLLFSLCLVLLCCTAFAQKYRAVITTTYGKIELFLYDNTPKHRDNFVKLAKSHFYDGTLFHRVIPDFMIQGGDPDSKTAKPGAPLGNGSTGYLVPAEIKPGNIHKRGVLAAARDNNPEKSSSGCQFYITVGKKFTDADLDNISKRTGQQYTPEQRALYRTIGGTPHLDGNYTVYGEVTSGMDIVDKIVKQPRDGMDRPKEDQKILKLRVKKKFLFFWI